MNKPLREGADTSPAPLLADVARFVAGLRLESVPPRVVAQAKLTLLDTLGCVAAGARTEEAQRLFRVEQARAPGEEATVIGAGSRLPVEAAARVNAYQGDIFELNDLTGGHAGIAIVPTVLALAEALGSPGRAIVEATIAGIEVTARIYGAYYSDLKPYAETGIAPPGIPSTFGAAAAASRLFGLDASQTAEALAIAGAIANWCPAEVIFGDGGTIKPMLFGSMPASAGIMAARYARGGLSGPPLILESPIGFFATVARRFDARKLTDGEPWYLSNPRRKMHACCGYIHSALDGVGALRRSGTDFAAAAEIRVAMPPYILPVISKNGAPTSANEARFHAEYCLAIAASGVDVIAPEHSLDLSTWLAKPAIPALMGKFRVSADPTLSHYHHARIEVVGRSGFVDADLTNKAPKGSPQNPLSDDEVHAKFRRLVRGLLDANDADRIISLVHRLEELESVAAIMATMAWEKAE